MDEERRPPLRRIHDDETLRSGISRFSLEYWRQRGTEEIIESLRSGKIEALKVKPDGRILNGNVRIRVLEERGFDINGLEREIVWLKQGKWMTVDEAIAIFLSYSIEEKEEFLAQLMHELTVIARDSYEVGRDGLVNPQRVRRINEVQHRISSFLCALLRNNPWRYPDDVLMKIILEHPDDSLLEEQLSESFARLTRKRLTIA
jgi:hypothetical protein